MYVCTCRSKYVQFLLFLFFLIKRIIIIIIIFIRAEKRGNNWQVNKSTRVKITK